MLSEVIAFGLILALFEFVLIVMAPPRLRLRLLGNETAKVTVHITMLCLNPGVHGGTVV